MATTTNFVVCFKSNNSVVYSALDSRDSLIKSENPLTFKKFFNHDDALKLVKALRVKGLDEGVEVRAKSLAQAVRDYSWLLIQKSQNVELADTETFEKIYKRYEVKETVKPGKTETAKEKSAKPAEVETKE